MSLKQILNNPLLLVISLLLNLVLITGLIYTLQKARQYYEDYRVFRPMAHGTSEASTFTPPENNAQKLMVMYGDSRVQEWTPLPRLENTLVVNAGVSGETLREIRRRLHKDVLRLNPDVVLLQAGMNDLTAAATRGVEQPEKIIRRMKSGMKSLVEELTARNIDVIMTPIIPAKPLNIGRKVFWRDEIDSLLADANIYLKSLADQHELQWIDLLEPLHNDSGELRTDWYFDTLHLHTARYNDLNTMVEKLLNQP
ncbi:MAG: GDSL-type esterase/lipase family protein [Pseudomonadota bacterium]